LALSLYLDGELSPRWRKRVERALSGSSSLRAEFDQLARVRKIVGDMPRHPLPGGLWPIADPTLPADRTALTAAEIDALLMAYAYGELDVRTRSEIDRLLLVDSAHRRTFRDHQRVADALSGLAKHELSMEVLAVAIDRLHDWAVDESTQLSSIESDKRSTWGEYLSAYLDGELSDKKQSKIQGRLEESDAARRYLADLSTVKASLQKLPTSSCPDVFIKTVLERIDQEAGLTTPNHFGGVRAGVVDVEWPDESVPSNRRRKRSMNWPALAGLAASVLVVAGVGLVLSGIPLSVGMLRSPAPNSSSIAQAEAEPSKETRPVAREMVYRPVGYERIKEISRAPAAEVIRSLDSQQITVAARDVQKFLDRLGPIGETLKRSEPTRSGGRLIELTGEPAEIAELMGRLAEASSGDETVGEIAIDLPLEESLTQIRKSSDRWVVAAETKLAMDVIRQLDEGIKSLGAQIQTLAEERKSQERVQELAQSEPIADENNPAPKRDLIPNEPVVLARPLRILMVVTPKRSP
jgi:anti-sigma factor RsiW